MVTDKSMKIKTEAYQAIKKLVKSAGHSRRVYVPKSWIGKRVKLLLLESADEE